MFKPAVLAVPLLLLAGCAATPPDNAGDGVLRVVASTNVYGDIAQQIGGDAVEVTSIIDDPAQDPHQFEANGRVQLALSRADVVIVNGGGYDDFAASMLSASGNTAARVIDAVELSGYDSGADGFNEHLWYDYPTVQLVAAGIADALSELDPAGATGFADRAAAFDASVQGLEERAADLNASASGEGVVITEPVPLYLLESVGLENLTPPEFSEAIEEDADVPPALLQQVLDVLSGGSAALVVYNEQTGGPQTDALLDGAEESGVPVIGVTETLPADSHYVDWQSAYLDQISEALTD